MQCDRLQLQESSQAGPRWGAGVSAWCLAWEVGGRGGLGWAARAKQNRTVFEHLFPLGRGEGAPASFNQDLKTGRPLIKEGRAPRLSCSS